MAAPLRLCAFAPLRLCEQWASLFGRRFSPRRKDAKAAKEKRPLLWRHLILKDHKSVPLSDVVFRLSDSGFARAVGAAIERVLGLDAMPDDPAAALRADRGQLLDRAFEAVEDVLPARRDHLEGQVIIVAANFTLSHVHTSSGKSMNRTYGTYRCYGSYFHDAPCATIHQYAIRRTRVLYK